MLDQDDPRLTVTDQEEATRMRHDYDKNLDDLLDEFSRVRAASVSPYRRSRKASCTVAGSMTNVLFSNRASWFVGQGERE